MPLGTRQPGGQRETLAPFNGTSGTVTLTAYDIGKVVTTRGATGACTVALPTPTAEMAGGSIRLISLANQNLIASCSGAVVTDNSLTSSSVALSTSSHKIGGGFEMFTDGTSWIPLPLVFSTQTVTVA